MTTISIVVIGWVIVGWLGACFITYDMTKYRRTITGFDVIIFLLLMLMGYVVGFVATIVFWSAIGVIFSIKFVNSWIKVYLNIDYEKETYGASMYIL